MIADYSGKTLHLCLIFIFMWLQEKVAKMCLLALLYASASMY
jgi:hypothetical protein